MFSFQIKNSSYQNSIIDKDGQIGATKQGKKAGDCWLLSSVNALRETQQGQDILSSIFEFHNEGSNGYTVVHLATGDYRVDDKEVLDIKNSVDRKKYSSGDDDMIILELAAEKSLNAIGDDYDFHTDTPYYIEKVDLSGNKDVKDSGNFEKAMYMLTGKAASAYQTNSIIKDGKVVSDINGIEKAIQQYMNGDNDGKVMNASIHSKKKISLLDVNTNKNIQIEGNHQYAVKDIKDNKVTLVNPWDSSKDIVISLDDFKNSFEQIEYIDLNKANNERNYVSDEYTTDGKNKTFIFRNEDGTVLKKSYRNGKVASAVLLNKDNNIKTKTVYDGEKKSYEVEYGADNGKTIYLYDKEGENKTKKIETDENGRLKGSWAFNKNSQEWETCPTTKAEADYYFEILNKKEHNPKELFTIKNEGINEHRLSKPEKDGKFDEKSSVVLTDNEYKKLNESGLLEHSQFSPEEIQNLLKLKDSDFNAAVNFIKSHEGIEYQFVERYLK